MADTATAQERLDDVRQAIRAIMYGGQSYKIGSRSLTRADLSMLRDLEKELEAEIAQEGDSPFFDDTYVGFFIGTGR